MNAVLSVVAGALRGRRYPLDPERAFSIGRSPSTDLQVDDPNVSRVHCRIQFHERRWEIQDLKSSNGTFVNGHRVERQPLAFGDRIRLGGLEIEFVAAREDWDSPDVTAPGTQLRMVAELPRPESRTQRVRIDGHAAGLQPPAEAPEPRVSDVKQIPADVLACLEPIGRLARTREQSVEGLPVVCWCAHGAVRWSRAGRAGTAATVVESGRWRRRRATASPPAGE
jgi:predicted component of type VI protein secretion system